MPALPAHAQKRVKEAGDSVKVAEQKTAAAKKAQNAAEKGMETEMIIRVKLMWQIST
jgi:hypothetical protein